MRVLLLMVMLILTPGWAFALSCAPPNLARSLNQALESGVPIVVAAGHLELVAADSKSRPRKDGRAVYRLKASELNRGGWLTEIEEAVRVETRCVAAWCGQSLALRARGVFLLTKDHTGALILRIGPCGGTVFPLPDAEKSQALERCVRQGRCGEADIALFERR